MQKALAAFLATMVLTPSMALDAAPTPSPLPAGVDAIRKRWLESARFPLAEFVSTEIRGLPQTYRDGQEVKLQVVGNLKIREVTRPTTFEATVRLQGAVLTATARARIRMTDFGFDPPSILGFVRVKNEVDLEIELVARRAR